MRRQTVRFLYKWLPILFGCHCRADRSFFWRGVQFPICARCTGIAGGMLLGAVCLPLARPSFRVLLLLSLPLVIDGSVQRTAAYESTNLRRLITGLLFGIALDGFLVLYFSSGFHLGRRLGERLFSTR